MIWCHLLGSQVHLDNKLDSAMFNVLFFDALHKQPVYLSKFCYDVVFHTLKRPWGLAKL